MPTPTCTNKLSPFKYLRITPTCQNPWVAAGNFQPNNPNLPYEGGITAPHCGLEGTVVPFDPATGCPRGITCPATPTYINQCTVINWYGLTGSAPLVDSTVAASANLLCSPPLVNYALKPEDLWRQFNCCSGLTPVPYSLACFGPGNPPNPFPPTYPTCPPTYCPGGALNPCVNGNNPIIPCTTAFPVDGITQFITQISASSLTSVQGPYGVFNFVIQPPSFPSSLDSTGSACSSTPPPIPTYGSNTNPFFNLFQGAQTPIKGYGNYNPIVFTIGGCANVPQPLGAQPCGPCSQLVTLLYIGTLCSSDVSGCRPFLYDLVANNNFLSCTIPTPETPDMFPVYYYDYIYANVVFTITDSNGYPRRCKNKPFNASCFLSVAPYNSDASFCVNFGQTRSCGGLNVIVVSNLVSINCLTWGGPVYVITTPATCFNELL